jgi:hypothetical protein
MSTSLTSQLSEARVAHEALLRGIAVFRATPSRETRMRADELIMQHADLILTLFDPKRAASDRRGRPSKNTAAGAEV